MIIIIKKNRSQTYQAAAGIVTSQPIQFSVFHSRRKRIHAICLIGPNGIVMGIEQYALSRVMIVFVTGINIISDPCKRNFVTGKKSTKQVSRIIFFLGKGGGGDQFL